MKERISNYRHRILRSFSPWGAPHKVFEFCGVSGGYPLVVITNGDDWIAAIDVLKIKETGCSQRVLQHLQ